MAISGEVLSGPGTLSAVIGKLPKKARLTAAVAYVSGPMGLPLKPGDRVYVNCHDSNIAAGATSPRVLRQWARQGVEIFNCDSLHAKVIVAGNWVAVGSMNLSQRADVVQEAAWMGREPGARAQAKAFLDSLAEVSVQVDVDWLKTKEDLFETKRTVRSGFRERADHERRPGSVLPMKVRRLHLAYGSEFSPDRVPKYVAAVRRAVGPAARFQGIVGGWPSSSALLPGDLLVWIETPNAHRLGVGYPPSHLGLMDAPILVTGRPERAGKPSEWFVGEYDARLGIGLPVPPLSKTRRERLWRDQFLTLTTRKDIDEVLAAWGLSSAPARDGSTTPRIASASL